MSNNVQTISTPPTINPTPKNSNKDELQTTIEHLKKSGFNDQLITLILELRKDKNFKDIMLLSQNKDNPYNPAFGNKQINQFTELYNKHFTQLMAQLAGKIPDEQLKLNKFFGLMFILAVNGLGDVSFLSTRQYAIMKKELYKISQTANKIYTNINGQMLSGADLKAQLNMFKDFLKYCISKGNEIPNGSNNSKSKPNK